MSGRDKPPVQILPKTNTSATPSNTNPETNTSATPSNTNPKSSAVDKGPAGIEGWDHWTTNKASDNEVVWSVYVPPNINLTNMPKFRDGQKMPVPVFIIAYIATWFFKPDGRQLLPEEIERITYAIYGDYSNPPHQEHLRKRLARQEVLLEGLSRFAKLGLIQQVACLLGAVLQKNAIAKQRFEGLKGFVGKLRSIPFGNGGILRPKLGGRGLLSEEVYFIYALINGYPDADKTRWRLDIAKIVEQKCNITFDPKYFRVYTQLEDENHPLAKYTAETFALEDHMTFFSREARKWHVKCSKKHLLEYYPVFENREIPAQSEPFMATTAEYFAALTVSAPPESSHQPAATFSELPLNFDEFLNSEAYAESGPDAEGGERGTVRARESSSGSPEGDVSGKGKQAVYKKPRAEK